jgi:branched-chain amino acid transport system ATP-binding protein
VVIELEQLFAGYDGLAVIRDLNFHIDEGEVVGLLGPNGAGKTTTLLTISGLLKPISGTVKVFGQTPSTRFPHRLAREGVAHVTESRNLFYELTVAENLRLGFTGPRAGRNQALRDALDLFPALEPLVGRRTALLSGGEQQMLALARALMSRPRVLLLDEMSLGLAPIIVERLLGIVRDITDRTGCSVVLVEQHVNLALRIIGRGYVLSHGGVGVEGSAEELKASREVLESTYMGEVALKSEAVPGVGAARPGPR